MLNSRWLIGCLRNWLPSTMAPTKCFKNQERLLTNWNCHLERIHPLFHVSLLKKTIEEKHIPILTLLEHLTRGISPSSEPWGQGCPKGDECYEGKQIEQGTSWNWGKKNHRGGKLEDEINGTIRILNQKRPRLFSIFFHYTFSSLFLVKYRQRKAVDWILDEYSSNSLLILSLLISSFLQWLFDCNCSI